MGCARRVIIKVDINATRLTLPGLRHPARCSDTRAPGGTHSSPASVLNNDFLRKKEMRNIYIFILCSIFIKFLLHARTRIFPIGEKRESLGVRSDLRDDLPSTQTIAALPIRRPRPIEGWVLRADGVRARDSETDATIIITDHSFQMRFVRTRSARLCSLKARNEIRRGLRQGEPSE